MKWSPSKNMVMEVPKKETISVKFKPYFWTHLLWIKHYPRGHHLVWSSKTKVNGAFLELCSMKLPSLNFSLQKFRLHSSFAYFVSLFVSLLFSAYFYMRGTVSPHSLTLQRMVNLSNIRKNHCKIKTLTLSVATKSLTVECFTSKMIQ